MKVKEQTGYIIQLQNPRHNYLNLDTIRYSARAAKAEFLRLWQPSFKNWGEAYKQGWRCMTVTVTLQRKEEV